MTQIIEQINEFDYREKLSDLINWHRPKTIRMLFNLIKKAAKRIATTEDYTEATTLNIMQIGDEDGHLKNKYNHLFRFELEAYGLQVYHSLENNKHCLKILKTDFFTSQHRGLTFLPETIVLDGFYPSLKEIKEFLKILDKQQKIKTFLTLDFAIFINKKLYEAMEVTELYGDEYKHIQNFILVLEREFRNLFYSDHNCNKYKYYFKDIDKNLIHYNGYYYLNLRFTSKTRNLYFDIYNYPIKIDVRATRNNQKLYYFLDIGKYTKKIINAGFTRRTSPEVKNYYCSLVNKIIENIKV